MPWGWITSDTTDTRRVHGGRDGNHQHSRRVAMWEGTRALRVWQGPSGFAQVCRQVRGQQTLTQVKTDFGRAPP